MNEGQGPLQGHPERLTISVDPEQYGSFCEAVVGCVGVGVLVVAPDGAHLLMNADMRRMMSYGFVEGHLGEAGQVGEVYTADGKTRLEVEDLPSTRAMRGDSFTDLRVVVGPQSGPRLVLSMTARTLVAHDGDILGIVVVASDVTALSEALDVKDRFVANVSHELRTPLASIIGFLALVLDEPDGISAEVRTHLTIVQRNSERLMTLLGGLLHPVTLGAHLEMNRAPTYISPLAEHAIASARPQADSVGVQLNLAADPIEPITVDGARLSEVFDNLISNALKFTPRGGRVDIRLEDNDNHVRIVVSDTGRGVDAADRDFIFNRFFRSARTEENVSAGVGIGLHIAHEIVTEHGGHIHVQASPDGGAEFVVVLPRESAP